MRAQVRFRSWKWTLDVFPHRDIHTRWHFFFNLKHVPNIIGRKNPKLINTLVGWDSNCRSLLSEATVLPTEPQTIANISHTLRMTYANLKCSNSLYYKQSQLMLNANQNALCDFKTQERRRSSRLTDRRDKNSIIWLSDFVTKNIGFFGSVKMLLKMVHFSIDFLCFEPLLERFWLLPIL